MADVIEEIEIKRDELAIKAEEYRKRRDNIEREASTWADKRDALNKKVRDLRINAEEQKKKVAGINEEIRERKHEIEVLKKEEKIISDKMRKLMREHLPKKGPYLSKLRDELKELEFKQMTSVLTPEKERDVIDRLAKLKSQVKEREDILKQNEEIKKILTTLDGLKNDISTRRKGIACLIKEAQDCRRVIGDTYAQADELRTQADSAHRKFIELMDGADKEHKEYAALETQIADFDKILSNLRRKERTALKVKVDESLKKKAHEIYERFKNGEKLSTEDLMTLQKAGLL